MSVENCDFSTYFDCYPQYQFSEDIEPKHEQGITTLNPQVYLENYSKDFIPIPLRKRYEKSACPTTQFYSPDPRLISSTHSGQVLTLDRPPLEYSMKLDKVADDKSLDGYGQNYRTYNDINAGQITYYIDKSIQDPFFNPLYVTSADAEGVLYKDPMGGIKAKYYRHPLRDDNPIGQPERDNYEGKLSWMQDSLGHRQDILALQMRKMNEDKWMPRWKNNKYN